MVDTDYSSPLQHHAKISDISSIFVLSASTQDLVHGNFYVRGARLMCNLAGQRMN